jgi:nucleotide sugar dehydrogenase
MKKGQLVVLESTVNPGVSEEIMLPILEKFSGLTCGTDFSLAHCPERINPGDAKWRVHNIPRVVGGYDKQSLETAYEFYSSIIEGQVKKMGSLKEAEAVKVTENSFRNINIAFVNELARSFSKLGIDVVNVIDGAATKPFSFMAHYPGCGIGGHCIPVDPYYLIDYAQKNGFEHEFLKLSCQINEEMPEYTVELMEAELEKKGKMEKGAKVTVLGLAYKANIDDCRESPAIEIIKELNKKGYSVSTYDPHVLSQSTAKSLDEAVEGASAVIVATNHTEFIDGLTPEYLKNKKIEILIDGKNCLNKDAMNETGISYRGIGR